MTVTPLERTTEVDRGADGVEVRVIDAMLACISRWGVAKTTTDDIARGAGISRATLYRAFPGGRDTLFEALLRHEARRFFGAVSARLEQAEDLEELVVLGAMEANHLLQSHRALRFVLVHEPELVLPALAFHRLDRALEVAVEFVTPHLGPFVPDHQTAALGADWVVRVLLSHVVNPSPHLDLTDTNSVRSFVRAYVIPVLQPLDHISPKEH